MVNKKVFLSFMIVMILTFIVGCSGSMNPGDSNDGVNVDDISNPEEKYFALLEKSANIEELETVYNYSLNLGGMMGTFMPSDIMMGIFVKGKKLKTVSEMSMMGDKIITYVYVLDDKIISCVKGYMGPMGDDVDKGQIFCESSSTLEGFLSFEQFLNITKLDRKSLDGAKINYLGKSKVAKRECEKFSIKITNLSKLNMMGEEMDDAKELEILFGTSGLVYEACFDKETGVGLEISFIKNLDSELLDETTTEKIISMKVVKFSTTVDDSVFDIPVSYSVKEAYADNNGYVYVLVDAFEDFNSKLSLDFFEREDFSGDRALLVNKEVDVSLKAFEKKVYKVNIGKTASYGITFDVCNGEDCIKDITASIMNSCLQNMDETSCNGDNRNLCTFKDGYCQDVNCFFKHEEECIAESKCYWTKSDYGDNMQCSDLDCGINTNEASCGTDSNCQWEKNYFDETYKCSDKSCFDYEDANSCDNSPSACAWDDDMGSCEFDL